MPDSQTAFLETAGWAGCRQTPIAGDASDRIYFRLEKPATGETAVLMSVPPTGLPGLDAFVKITRHLRRHKFSAPEILAANRNAGFLLLEDYGDALFGNLLSRNPANETRLYAAAIDVLATLRNTPLPQGLTIFTPEKMAGLISPVFEWYCKTPTSGIDKITRELELALTRFSPNPSVMALRDYHVENLFWLPDRGGVKKVGLIDYQDAVATHPAYDVASLLGDARRDVSPAIKNTMITRYVSLTDTDQDAFVAALAVQGAQRNLRILGIFARLCIDKGKPGYIDLVPRVWNNLLADLDHPDLSGLKQAVLSALASPTPAVLKELKNRCKKSPGP
jgi:aminoglycoside/choline kinase family phosphotransferase